LVGGLDPLLREQERYREAERSLRAELRFLDVVVGLERRVDRLWPILNTRPPPPSGTSQVLSLSASQLAVMIGAETRNQPSGRL
jgi:hypothetical protein